VARLWSELYFSWHSEEVDEFGYDPKFTRTILPLFEFLYTVWWRVEATGVENVPGSGPGLIVANHSRGRPSDGVMINLAVRHEHPARRVPHARPRHVRAAAVPGPDPGPERRRAGEPGERGAAAGQGRAGRRVPGGREGRGQEVQGPLPPGPLRARGLRAPGPAHGRAPRAGGGGGGGGDPPAAGGDGLAGPSARPALPAHHAHLPRPGPPGRDPAPHEVVDRLRRRHRHPRLRRGRGRGPDPGEPALRAGAIDRAADG